MRTKILLSLLVLIAMSNCLRIVPVPQSLLKGNSTLNIAEIKTINFEFKTPQSRLQMSQMSSSEFVAMQTQRENDLRKFREISSEIINERLPKLAVKKNNKMGRLNSLDLIVRVNLNNTNTKYSNYDNFVIDEAYEIKINSNLTQVELHCHGYVSFLRALETFMQIVHQSYQKTHFEFDFLPLHIKDAPVFGHRGVMIDNSRHFLSLESIKQTIRGLSISKFNVLHLHLTDSESFSFEMKKYPGLTTYGAYSPEEVYTQKQLKELDTYAQKYGVILIPEYDSPAHTRSWSNDPELRDIDSCRDYPKPDWGLYCNEPPCGQLDVTLQKSRDVSEAIMVELADIFSSEYLHLGGDEPNTKCWQSKPSIAAYMKEHNIPDYEALQSHYREFQKSAIEKNKLNKKRIFWLASNNAGVQTDKEAIMQFWGDESEYAELQKIENPIILSTYTYIYLDCGFGNLVGDNSWCDPYKTWKRIYSLDVTAQGAISRDRILGSEAALWTELSTTEDYIMKIFPRTIALNMNLWNPDNKLGEVELVKHLLAIRNQINLAGIPAGAISSQYCELNVEVCFFDE